MTDQPLPLKPHPGCRCLGEFHSHRCSQDHVDYLHSHLAEKDSEIRSLRQGKQVAQDEKVLGFLNDAQSESQNDVGKYPISNDLDEDLKKLGYVPEVIARKGDALARILFNREELKAKIQEQVTEIAEYVNTIINLRRVKSETETGWQNSKGKSGASPGPSEGQMRLLKIHKRTVAHGGFCSQFCGLFSLDWKKVTCKNCIKKRKRK